VARKGLTRFSNLINSCHLAQLWNQPDASVVSHMFEKLGNMGLKAIEASKRLANRAASVFTHAKQVAVKAAAPVIAVVVTVWAQAAQAGTDATAITTAASSAWTSVAELCVLIGTFVVVYRLVRKVR